MNINRLSGIFIAVTLLIWILIFALSPQPKYQEINIINIPNPPQPQGLINNLHTIEPYKVESQNLSIDLKDNIPSAKERIEQVNFNLYVYKLGAFGSSQTVAKLVKLYNDAGFPAFTQINQSNNQLTNVFVGPFASQNDVTKNQERLNQIPVSAGFPRIDRGEVLSWKP